MNEILTRTRSVLRDSVLADEIDFLAVKAFARGSRISNRLLAPLGLRTRSYSVLALAGGEGAVTQRDLAEYLALGPSQIVALVDELEGNGLVHRDVDPSDRRSRLIRATPAGMSRLVEARRLTIKSEEESMAVLSLDDRETLRRLLQTLVFGG